MTVNKQYLCNVAFIIVISKVVISIIAVCYKAFLTYLLKFWHKSLQL
jgi:hypothetical protein